jgi:predicted Ser/Thr protein kinase
VVLGEVGRGGMGVVYKAWQRGAERLVALKLIRNDFTDEETPRDRFAVEAKALARLHHPNIVQIYEVGEHDGRPFFSLEFVPGGNLAARLRNGETPAPAESARLVEALAGAVEAAHRAGVLHRDIKPGNVLLAADGAPKLNDFGLAKRLDFADHLTLTGAVLGTPSYMAPEQAAGRTRDVGPRTDVYALGATFYELLTGRPPFRSDTPVTTATLVVHAAPSLPRQVSPGVPAELEAVCLKCLEKDPARRYASASELAADLGRWRRGEPTKARPLSFVQKLRRRVLRHRWAAAAVLVLVLAGLGAAVARREADALVRIDRQLARGEAVTLVGENGMPRWHRWRLGPTALAPSVRVADGTCSFQTAGVSLLELHPAPRIDRYRITAELRLDGTTLVPLAKGAPPVGRAGLYFGYQDLNAVAAEATDRFWVVDFAEQWHPGEAANPELHRVEFTDLALLKPPFDGNESRTARVQIGGKPFVPRVPFPRPWRAIRVEVTPGAVLVHWRNEAGEWETVKSVPPARLSSHSELLQESLTKMKPGYATALGPFDPHAPFGVFAFGSAVSIRNVVLEPLSP